jgi:hypothetical protein
MVANREETLEDETNRTEKIEARRLHSAVGLIGGML